jgi:hypothetical protein
MVPSVSDISCSATGADENGLLIEKSVERDEEQGDLREETGCHERICEGGQKERAEYGHRSLASIIDGLVREIPIPHQEPIGYCTGDFHLDDPNPQHRRRKQVRRWGAK